MRPPCNHKNIYFGRQTFCKINVLGTVDPKIGHFHHDLILSRYDSCGKVKTLYDSNKLLL